jgi:hypothetical protein
MKSLPRTPSALIELALADLEKAENSDRYVVDMTTWHDGDRYGCAVCLAGSVMAFSLGFDSDLPAEPADIGGDDMRALYALDCLRTGQIDDGLDYLDIEIPEQRKDELGRWRRNVTHYEDYPDKFKADMRELAADLKELGL